MNPTKRFIAAFLAALGLGFGAHAASTTYVDYTDIWWNSGESGWGAGLTMQDNVIFVTLFVQGADRGPVYFTSDMHRQVTPGLPPAPLIWSGTLYRSTGPYFGGAYDASTVKATPVGRISVEFTSPTTAVIDYAIDGANVRKFIARQTFRADTLAGDYKGGVFASGTNCTGGDGRGVQSYPGSFKVTQEANKVTIVSTFTPTYAEGGSCKLTGTLVQEGRIGKITDGRIDCEFVNGPTPTTATFSLTDIEFGENGFSGVFSSQEGPACKWSGHFGGIRRGYPEPPTPVDPGIYQDPSTVRS
jgi:hypothetical protein